MKGGEEVVLFLAEAGIDCGARGQDSGNFAANDLLGELGVLHLLADGNPETFAQQPLKVAFRRVIRDTTHWDGAFTVAGGKGDLQLSRGDDCVVVEELVEVTHSEEEQGVGILRFRGRPLAHEGGERVSAGTRGYLCGRLFDVVCWMGHGFCSE